MRKPLLPWFFEKIRKVRVLWVGVPPKRSFKTHLPIDRFRK